MSLPMPRGGRRGAAAVQRLARLCRLDEAALAALDAATARATQIRTRSEVVQEGEPFRTRLLILEGWLARIRILPDGRRQIIGFILPGELIGHEDANRNRAASGIIALTEALVCPAPEPATSPTLASAYSASYMLGETHLLAQITRLGRLSAVERIVDLLLELHDRLSLAGLARDGQFALPITQEALGDTLGLTSIHVNRMLQQARQAGMLSWKSGIVTLHDIAAIRGVSGSSEPAASAA